MIVSLRGTLLHKGAQEAVIECHGVGFGVALSSAAQRQLGAPGSEACVLIYTHMAQDSLRLYGFVDPPERRTFEVLIHTSGVGPRLALSILAALGPQALAEAVRRQHKASLTRIAGIGQKKAERLLLELKDKLDVLPAATHTGSSSAVFDDLCSALLHLGFAAAVAQEAAHYALQQAPEEDDVARLIRLALQSTTKRTEDKK